MANKYHEKEETSDDKPKALADEWQDKTCDIVLLEWSKGQSYTSDLNELYEDLYDMIRGERPVKNYDWQSNVVLNKAFQIVWTTIPYCLQKIFGADPIIGVSSANKQGAYEREKILQFWATMQPATNSKHRAYFLVMVMWLLRALLNGVGINKKSWHQVMQSKTQTMTVNVPTGMEGEEGQEKFIEEQREIKRTIRFPKEDWPVNTIINNRDIVCDWILQPGESIRQGRFIVHREVYDLDYLYNGPIKYKNLDKVKENIKHAIYANSTKSQDASKVKNKDAQNSPPESEIYAEVEVFERQGVFLVKKTDNTSFNKQGLMPCFEKEDIGEAEYHYTEMIATVACTGKDKKKTLIRFEPNPYKEKTYVDLHIFFDSERWQSVGQIEPVADLITAQNDHLNAMFDEIWQGLMPPVIVNKYALWDWDTMYYAPQQRWLVGGNPQDAIAFPQARQMTGDAWQKHALLETEQQLTSSVTNAMQGAGREKAATTNVLNAQMSAGKLDFVVKMIEMTGLIPSAQMDIRFAQIFAHPLTFQMILGKPFQFKGYEELYKYTPAASAVKLEHQKQNEIQSDVQIMGILQNIQNPNAAKIMNLFIANILRNKDMPDAAELLDENFYEPSTPAGNLQMLERQYGGGATPNSNQEGIQMSGPEQNVRRSQNQPRGIGRYGTAGR